MSMSSRYGTVLAAALSAATLLGQGERASVTGTVTDSTQAVVPSARIAVRNVATNVITRAESNNEGIYYVTSLPPGQYDLTAEKQGFRPSRIANIPLSVNLTATINGSERESDEPAFLWGFREPASS